MQPCHAQRWRPHFHFPSLNHQMDESRRLPVLADGLPRLPDLSPLTVTVPDGGFPRLLSPFAIVDAAEAHLAKRQRQPTCTYCASSLNRPSRLLSHFPPSLLCVQRRCSAGYQRNAWVVTTRPNVDRPNVGRGLWGPFSQLACSPSIAHHSPPKPTSQARSNSPPNQRASSLGGERDLLCRLLAATF